LLILVFFFSSTFKSCFITNMSFSMHDYNFVAWWTSHISN
jgi:hypothetical protein